MEMLQWLLFASVAVLSCFPVYPAASLPADEVKALEQIGKKLGKNNWNFTQDPCKWSPARNPNTDYNYADTVSCNCSYSDGTVCHVDRILLKAQNLSGTLPPELAKLPNLLIVDLTRNYLQGTIPREWGSMKLVNIFLSSNRLNGSIPKELGNISTLLNLTLENNQLSGFIPPELGNLSSIKRIHLASNKFMRHLPETLAKLTTLEEFQISDNYFEGPLPSFIQNWTSLTKLFIQSSGLSGPIPPSIALLENMTDLRITDLNGTEGGKFPPLQNMRSLKRLILRSCNITGPLPEYLSNMTKLKILDLSFNKLSGEIPESFKSLPKTDYIYLTGNLLNGSVPSWMGSKGVNVDLSYNNFTSAKEDTCQQWNVNLFPNPSESKTSGTVPCMGSPPCPKKKYSLHINCGGGDVTIGKTKYEADSYSSAVPSMYKPEPEGSWSFSSTGNFLDDNVDSDSYIAKNNSAVSMINSTLYMTARLSPLSLSYYGVCLENGNYTVHLHFAEIMFTNDETYSSLGRRIFDIYVQGKRQLKDFNIMDEARVAGNSTTKSFNASVTRNSIEIRFYWAGRGTQAIPRRGVYGPLISAISVESNNPPVESTISAGTMVTIVVAVIFVIFLVLCVLWWKGCLGGKEAIHEDLKGLDLQTGSFTLRQIKAATKNFDQANKIGEGGFGSVYKGLLLDGTTIAVKQLSSKSKQGNREFVNEIGMISALQHPHLVRLYGCCIEGNQLLLVYEYMENNSLARALFGPKEYQLKLDWLTRRKICIGIARGLAYLHEESRLKVVHRDIKATNVLLDENLNPKISDFGLAKLDEEENTHISTRIAGT